VARAAQLLGCDIPLVRDLARRRVIRPKRHRTARCGFRARDQRASARSTRGDNPMRIADATGSPEEQMRKWRERQRKEVKRAIVAKEEIPRADLDLSAFGGRQPVMLQRATNPSSRAELEQMRARREQRKARTRLPRQRGSSGRQRGDQSSCLDCEGHR
jgi:hypothetical protein